MNVEPVGKQQQLAVGQIGGNLILIEFGLSLVGGKNHDDIGPPGSFSNRGDFEAGLLRLHETVNDVGRHPGVGLVVLPPAPAAVVVLISI